MQLPAPSTDGTAPPPTAAESVPAAAPTPASEPTLLPAVSVQPPTVVAIAELVPVEPRVEFLERLAGELADQRSHLMEQCARLVQAQQRWQSYRRTTAAELESLGRRLLEREYAIAGREQTLETAEVQLRQHQGEALHLQRHLEGWQARMTARETSWEGERDRLLADLEAREACSRPAASRGPAPPALGETPPARGRMAQVRTRRLREAARECVTLRDEWLRRAAALEQEQRRLAEQALAMEQYQQETLGQADNASAAGKRLDKLRKRWASQSAAAEKAVAQQRQEMRTEAARIERFHGRLQNHAAKLASREAELSRKQSEWEHGRLQMEDELTRLRQELASQRAHSSRFERQTGELRDEVERLARLFLDEAEPVRLPTRKRREVAHAGFSGPCLPN